MVVSLDKLAAPLPSRPEPQAPTPFTRMALSRPNPYAALAPKGSEPADVPVPDNPYAELAPNFESQDSAPQEGPEPAHWSAMLAEWSDDDRPGFFQRYV